MSQTFEDNIRVCACKSEPHFIGAIELADAIGANLLTVEEAKKLYTKQLSHISRRQREAR